MRSIELERQARFRLGMGYVTGAKWLSDNRIVISCQEGVAIVDSTGQIIDYWPHQKDMRVEFGVAIANRYLVLPTVVGLAVCDWNHKIQAVLFPRGSITRICQSNSGLVAAMHRENGVIFYRPAKKEGVKPGRCLTKIRTCPIHYFARIGAWSHDNKVFVYSSGTDIVIFAQPRHKRTRTWLDRPSKYQERPVHRTAIAVGPDMRVAVGWADGVLDLYEPAVLSLEQSVIVKRLERDETLQGVEITSVCWPTDQAIIAGLENGGLAWRSPQTPNWRMMQPHNGPVYVLESCWPHILSGSYDGAIYIWRAVAQETTTEIRL